MNEFQDRTVFIADAAAASGRALAVRMAQDNARLILAGEGDEAPLCALCEQMEPFGCTAVPCVCDYTARGALARAVDAALAACGAGRIDAFFYNRQQVIRGAVAEVPLGDVDKCIDEQIAAAFFCTQVIAQRMAEGAGAVYLGSIHSEKPTGCAPLYSMAMGALKNMVREAALYYGYRGVRFNLIEQSAARDARELQSSALTTLYEGYEYKTPTGRVPTAEDTAELARFLLSDACRAVNGAELRVDGGLVLSYSDLTVNTWATERERRRAR